MKVVGKYEEKKVEWKTEIECTGKCRLILEVDQDDIIHTTGEYWYNNEDYDSWDVFNVKCCNCGRLIDITNKVPSEVQEYAKENADKIKTAEIEKTASESRADNRRALEIETARKVLAPKV